MTESIKIVAFQVGSEEFGVDINRVISIERMQSIVTIPKMPPHVTGIIHLRGEVIPVMDLRKILFGSDEKVADTTRIITVNIHDGAMGLIVDTATDVFDIPSQVIQHHNLLDKDTSFIAGIARLENRLLILLEIDELLSISIENLKILWKRGKSMKLPYESFM